MYYDLVKPISGDDSGSDDSGDGAVTVYNCVHWESTWSSFITCSFFLLRFGCWLMCVSWENWVCPLSRSAQVLTLWLQISSSWVVFDSVLAMSNHLVGHKSTIPAAALGYVSTSNPARACFRVSFSCEETKFEDVFTSLQRPQTLKYMKHHSDGVQS